MMGLLDILGGGKTLAAPIEAVGSVLDKVVTTDKDRANAEQVMALIRQNPILWQVTLNQLNAQSNRWFDSGWRPFIGWIGGLCLGFYFLPQFTIAAYLWCNMCIAQGTILPYPIKADQLMELVYLLLGFGAYHIADRRINR
jgi:Holin of 3TMs, for gene-transfer release